MCMRFNVLKEHFELISDPAFSSVLETKSSHSITGLALRICLIMNHLQKTVLETKKPSKAIQYWALWSAVNSSSDKSVVGRLEGCDSYLKLLADLFLSIVICSFSGFDFLL